ncbi:MAG: toll/interleukin-1 receptor domain-containing protein [Hyphomonadaceae bacterium]|nr:toll/interleukin-1 receptor domain-containing protein [Hyphomonadaceae bacterium]
MASHELEIFEGSTEMRRRILDHARSSQNGVRKLRLYGFNFGNTSTRLIEDLSIYLASDFEVEVLAWDTQITRLKSRTDADAATLLKATNLERTYNVLNAVVDSDHGQSVSDTFAELLILGSDILITKQRHKELLKGTATTLQDIFSEPELADRMGYVRMRVVPNYVPAMCVILDDKIFVRLYTSQRHQVGFSASSSNELYRHLNDHFEEVWSKATDIFGEPMGLGAEEERRIKAPATHSTSNQTEIFISYRRNDSAWAAAALHDRLSMAFGLEKVFLDHRTIRETTDWDAELDNALKSARVFIPLFGPQWASEDNIKSLTSNPEDMVLYEFEEALSAKPPKVILPVLVDHHAWPNDERFPEAVRQVLKKQSRRKITFETYHQDAADIVNRIIKELER